MNMESLKLSEYELKSYGEIFGSCDVESTGKINGVKATELFLASGLPQEALQVIIELCGAKRLGHFGRSQFYIALKLIAAAQNGLPVAIETVNMGHEIPLPKFKNNTESEPQRQTSQQEGPEGQFSNNLVSAPPSGGLPPPPTKQHVRGMSGQRPVAAKTMALGDTPLQPTQVAPQVPVTIIQHQRKVESPHHGTQSPTLQQSSPRSSPKVAAPTSHVIQNGSSGKLPDKGWASFEDDSRGLISNDSNGHVEKDPMNPENEEWMRFQSSSDQQDTSSISSDTSSQDDVWSITDEQREYYTNQFKTMQSDLNGVISGADAKDFFEKSKLPVQELSKIWNLADVNKDGALSLEEFFAAMHLVVLRRNDIELPDHLPPSLIPYIPLTASDEPFAADLPPGSTIKRTTPTTPPANMWVPTVTYPIDSPASSSVSSPGCKPVNFDFRPIQPDPLSLHQEIAHPVALRMSPDGQAIPADGATRDRTVSEPISYDAAQQQAATQQQPPSQQPDLTSPRKQRSYTIQNTESLIELEASEAATSGGASLGLNTPLQSRPRPTPKKAHSAANSNTEAILLPPPIVNKGSDLSLVGSQENLGGEGSDHSAPTPPPRPHGHSRSSSLDANDILQQGNSGGLMMPPPVVPPRGQHPQVTRRKLLTRASDPAISVVQNKSKNYENFANFAKFESIPSQEGLNVDSDNGGSDTTERHRRSYSLDYNRLGGYGADSEFSTAVLSSERSVSPTGGATEPGIDDFDRKVNRHITNKDKKEIQMLVRKQKEKNTMLYRLNGELNQELQEVMEQRIALEIQMEHLRPF
ncbi:unnamed protein product, partial [Owenia fusiformis]